MAYTIHDENGFLGHGPCINGLRQLKNFVNDKDTKSYGAIHQLVQHGATNQVTKLAIEARALAAQSQNPDIKSSLQSLARDASKAKGAIILGS